MKKINGMEFEDLRIELDGIIKDKSTTQEELILMFEFFREHMYVVDNEIKQRAWKEYQKKNKKEEKK